MPTYAHVRDGELTERTTTVPGSSHHMEMVGKAADPASGWGLDVSPEAAPPAAPPSHPDTEEDTP